MQERDLSLHPYSGAFENSLNVSYSQATCKSVNKDSFRKFYAVTLKSRVIHLARQMPALGTL